MHSVAGSPSPSVDSPLERIGRIANVIAGSGAANEALGRLTPEVLDKLHEQRLLRLLLPKAYGGDELDLVTWFRAMEALAKLDGSTAWCVGQINGCAATASALEPAVSRKIWGEPRAALSWGPPIRCQRARPHVSSWCQPAPSSGSRTGTCSGSGPPTAAASK